MTDALLITPPFQYAKLREAGPACPRLGLIQVAAVLEARGYKVKVLDFFVERKTRDEIRKLLQKNMAPVVCATSVTSEFPEVLKILKTVKGINKDTVTVLGGPHATIMPETTASEYIDYIVVGEGDYTAAELLDFILKGKGEKSKIDGIGYKLGNKMHLNKPRPLIKNLDELPMPAYHLIPMEKYRPYAIYDTGRRFSTAITSRGCPYSCAYCTSSAVFGHMWRAMSAEKAFELVSLLYNKYNIRHLYFQDDEFTINMKRTEDICDRIIENKMDLIWECLSRVNSVNDQLLSKMARAGCRGMVYGVECGYQEGIDRINKRITLEQALNAVRLTKKNGISARASFIMGFPWEGVNEIKKTIAFAKKLDPDIVYFQVLIPYPGTSLYKTFKEEKLIVGNDWTQFVQHSIVGTEPIIRTRKLTSEDLKYWNARGYLEFYARPKFIAKKLLQMKSLTQITRNAKAGYGLIRNALKRTI